MLYADIQDAFISLLLEADLRSSTKMLYRKLG